MIIEVANARWTADGKISADIRLEGDDAVMPYTASKDDPEEYGRSIFDMISSGAYGEIKECSEDEALRNAMLNNEHKKNEKISLADSVIRPMTGYALAGILSDKEKEKFKEWNEYRKALDCIDTSATSIEWPEEPE